MDVSSYRDDDDRGLDSLKEELAEDFEELSSPLNLNSMQLSPKDHELWRKPVTEDGVTISLTSHQLEYHQKIKETLTSGMMTAESLSIIQETRGERADLFGSSSASDMAVETEWMKQGRGVSAALSYLSLQSDWSKDFPLDFKGGHFPDYSCVSPAPSCLSMKSHRSIGLPCNFKEVPYSCELSSRLLSTVHLRCCVCSDILSDPVSIPCGHSYCKHCINTYWSQPGPTGDYVCRQCEQSYPVRPVLGVNKALTWVLQVLQHTDFTCDICSSQTRRAVKICLTCNACYCEKHVSEHYTVPALQKHTLEDTRPSEREEKSGRMEELIGQ